MGAQNNKYINIKDISFPKGFFNQDLNVPKMFEWLNSLPPADVQEVRHGAWKYKRESFYRFACSECGYHQIDPSRHCPHCGAKMDGGSK